MVIVHSKVEFGDVESGGKGWRVLIILLQLQVLAGMEGAQPKLVAEEHIGAVLTRCIIHWKGKK